MDAGNKAVHQPVLVQEVLDALNPRSKGIYADLTLGGGGHGRALLEASRPDGYLLGLDRDAEILEIARKALGDFAGRFHARQGNFSRAAEVFSDYVGRIEGVVMDLGVSSFQLDQGQRGFSIFKDAPFDLRMDASQKFSGRELVNEGKPEDLLYAIGRLGDEPRAKAIVKAIVNERQKRPLLHTSDIRNIVEQVYGRKGGKIHPATKTFQGLRMVVNRELESLQEGLEAGFQLLGIAGRMAVISFHSGEDRVVKAFFQERGKQGDGKVLSRKPYKPSGREVSRNRRSRSASLRVLEKLETR